MENKTRIAGIQQIGIGVENVKEAFTWYRKNLSIDIPIFEEAAEANLMLPYTGGLPHQRHAILAINIQGGGGFEIWQYTSRKPQKSTQSIQLGDLGIFAATLKSRNPVQHQADLQKRLGNQVSALYKNPKGADLFFVQDPAGNFFQFKQGLDWFTESGQPNGGCAGAIIGVSNAIQSKQFYNKILGYDKVIYEGEGTFEDLSYLPGGKGRFRRILLGHSQGRTGPFNELLGPSEIELIQSLDRQPQKIFKERFWGDLGFIHLCFDINGMKAMKANCEKHGYPFTVESNPDFDMGEAAGQFSYIEDPDGTLIEFVETHKVPVLKKLGLYLNLRKRDPEKALPKFMLKLLALNRVKG